MRLPTSRTLDLLLILILPSFVCAEVTSTVIDILSENVEFSYFLRLLQRNQLIPYLNQLENITLVAPVNSAFVDADIAKFGIDSLNRYIIKEPVDSTISGYYITQTIDKLPILIHGGDNFKINHKNVVEPDLFAETQGSFVQGIDRVFEPLKPVRDAIDLISDTHVVKSLLREIDLANTTILLPLDSSFQFEDYQLNYLFSDYGLEDSASIANSLIIDGIYGGDINETDTNRNGQSLTLSSTDDGEHLIINDTLVSVESNLLSSESVIHTFEDQSLIEEIEFNAKKTLIGLDAAPFVDELILQKLEYLITDNDLEQTIFYAKDSNPFTTLSKSSNLYHFVPERIDDLSKAKPLYDTKFCSNKKLGGGCQKIKVEVISDDTIMLNNNILVEDGPYKVGSSVIYLTDDNVRTPGDIISSVSILHHCSTTINYLSTLKLLKLANNNEGYTLFLPCFGSYDDFALTFNYLENNKTALEIIMKNLILNTPVYSDIQDETLETTNLNNDPVVLNSLSGNDTDLHLSFNDDSLHLKKNQDILFSQGVIQPIHELIFPNEINVTLHDIISSSDAELFLDYIKLFPSLNNLLTTDPNYSILLPSSISLSNFEPFQSNATLENFLKLHIIPPSSLSKLYHCEQDIQTLNPKVNLTCSRIPRRPDFLLSIANGVDNSVRVLSKGCTTSNQRHACVYALDKPINPSWISDHYHLSLPGIALGVGMLLGSVTMVMLLLCGMVFVVRRKSATGTKVADEEATEPETNGHANGSTANENTPLISDTAGSSFEQGYSNNSNVEAISFGKKKVNFTQDLN